MKQARSGRWFLGAFLGALIIYLSLHNVVFNGLAKVSREDIRDVQGFVPKNVDLGSEPDKEGEKQVSLPKIYVYDLPESYNRGVLAQLQLHCFNFTVQGYGKVRETFDGVSMRNTFQGALEVIIHHRILASKRYRTMDPCEADMFYIPFYDFLTYRFLQKNVTLPDELVPELTNMKYYGQGKPHFMSPGWPEQIYNNYLKRDWNFTYIVVEKHDRLTTPRNVILAPYPSFAHYTTPNGGLYVEHLFDHPRKVRVFMAAKGRPGGDFAKNVRHQIFEAISSSDIIDKSLGEIYKERNLTTSAQIDFVTYSPNTSCMLPYQSKHLMEWMRNSVFCLQPPGDSNTRKSFFDSLLSGCIPVTFQVTYLKHVSYPFENLFDYSEFSVMIPSNHTLAYQDYLQKYDDDSIGVLQQNVLKVMQYLQYNDPSAYDVGEDAFDVLISELVSHFKL